MADESSDSNDISEVNKESEENDKNTTDIGDIPSSSDSDGDTSSDTETGSSSVVSVSSYTVNTTQTETIIDGHNSSQSENPDAAPTADSVSSEEKISLNAACADSTETGENTNEHNAQLQSQSQTNESKDTDTENPVNNEPQHQKDAEDSKSDQTTDLSSSQPEPKQAKPPPEETVVLRPRSESTISGSSDEFSERPLSWTSSGSDRFSVQSESKLSVWSGSSIKSSSSYAPSISDHSDQELEPDDPHKPHRGRMTVKKKDEPKDLQEKRKKKAFNIVKEIMTTEETFVKVLKLLNESYRSAILRAGNALGRPVLPQETMANILKHLPELQNLNETLLNDFVKRIKDWDNNPIIADVFIKKGPFLKLYVSYISDFESLTSALDEARKKYPDFDCLTKAFEMSPKCNSLAVKHYMLKPVQRIPQYKLLLQDYLKQLNEDTEEYQKTKEALKIVSEVANHANENMKFHDNVKKLWDIQHSLIGPFEVIKPGRQLIKSGILKKLSRKVMQPRMFFLFTDVLLYTTPVATGYKLNNAFPLISLKVSRPNQEDFQNEFSIISTQRSFIISASTPEERDEWLKTIQEAIDENISKRQTFDVTKLSSRKKKTQSVVPSDNDMRIGFKLGAEAPVWIPDDRVTMCMLCTEEFTITFRRHHCRACGKIVCSYCSENKAPLQYLNYKAVRVCSYCFTKLLEEAKRVGGPDNFMEGGESVSPATVLARFKGFNWASFRPTKSSRPTVLNEVKANDEDATISGYLKVWKGYKWKKRWFVLKNSALYTFKAPEDAAAIHSVALLGLVVKTFKSLPELQHVSYEGLNPELVFELIHKGTSPMTFRAESLPSRNKWVAALKHATEV